MSSDKQAVTVRDLVEEAKKRIVFLIICVVGLSYLMSLTSSSVLVNLPAAVLLIIFLRYLSLDFETRRKAATYRGKSSSANCPPHKKTFNGYTVTVEKSDWRLKVNSPVVEDAIDQFTKHIVSEWVTDLWYSRITPDRQGPEELVQIMNGVLAEISCRMKTINLIDLLTRDIIKLICTHLELFRASKTKTQSEQLRSLTMEQRDARLKYVLAKENKLHPALFSGEAEHKVLQHIMDGLISCTFRPEDLQCSLFRYIVRELLACAVMRPVLNLASPRFINERIESLVISLSKSNRESPAAQVGLDATSTEASEVASDNFSWVVDPSTKGVELVQLKKDQYIVDEEQHVIDNVNDTLLSKDPLLAVDTRSSRSWSSLPSHNPTNDGRGITRHSSGGEWGNMLDLLSRRKTEGLAPEHFDNMWAKGRNYKNKEEASQLADPIPQSSQVGQLSNAISRRKEKDTEIRGSGHNKGSTAEKLYGQYQGGRQNFLPDKLKEEEHKPDMRNSDEAESGSTGSYTSEDEESTGLDSPSVKVWDGKNIRNVNHIHHPLESFEGHKRRKPKTDKGKLRPQRLIKTPSARKRSRFEDQKGDVWEETERMSFSLGQTQDILNLGGENMQLEDSSAESESETLSRISNGATLASMSSITSPQSQTLDANPAKGLIIAESFLKLRCEVLGANIVKSGSKTFAVYSVSVTDVNNHSWSIKRRFRHFEELHQRLKVFPEYNLHLPPKHFLSTGLDVHVIQERCKLLDKYLKKLLQLPAISSSIEVWDFLSVDSQTYSFSNSLSVIETLSVNLADTARQRNGHQVFVRPVVEPLPFKKGPFNAKMEPTLQMRHDSRTDSRNIKNIALSPPKRSNREFGRTLEGSTNKADDLKNKISSKNIEKSDRVREDCSGASSELPEDASMEQTLPSEWVPPNLSVPILDLVDMVFQLRDGGWIRRKAFWVAKQVLQLGMGDAFDDWLIEKIQLLRRGSVVAAGISRVEQILWPDGIFITKHPSRQRPNPSVSTCDKSPHTQSASPISSPKMKDLEKLDEVQQKEADRRAKLVYELMIDKAPAAVVGLVGRREYEQCAKDLYYFIQSVVCVKQLAFDLLELLLLSAFPELDTVFRQLHEDKGKFGELALD